MLCVRKGALLVRWKEALETRGARDYTDTISTNKNSREKMKPYSFDCQDMETLHPSRRGPVPSPVVEWPNPNPSIHTDESQPHMQLGCNLIEFSWFQWAHTQDLQVPVFAFDKQMTPMELRSQPAKTRVREKNKVPYTDKPNIDSHRVESNDVYPRVCWAPVGSVENSFFTQTQYQCTCHWLWILPLLLLVFFTFEWDGHVSNLFFAID